MYASSQWWVVTSVAVPALIRESFPDTSYSGKWTLEVWRDTFLEWELFSYREDVWRGLAHIQEIIRDVLSESKEHLNLLVCLLHKWTLTEVIFIYET